MTVITKHKITTYSEYKDSGVEWLGDIPQHWEIVKLGGLLKNISDKNHPSLPLLSITREKGVIVRNIEDDSENHNYIPDDLSGYKLLKHGQFGMNKMKAWQGSYGVSPQTGIVSPAYYIFEFTKPVLPIFFHLAIRSKRYVSFFGSASDGVRIGQWDLSKDRMKKIPFFLPPLKEQTAIAIFLDKKTTKIDQAIAQKEQLIELLKERKQILIQNAVTKGLNPNVKLKDSGVEWIGNIPEHWEVKRLKYVTKLVSDKVNSKDSLFGYIGMENIQSWTGKFISTNSETDGLANHFSKGDVLFGKLRPYLAKVYLAEKEGICSTEFLVYRTRKSIYNRYLNMIMLSFEFVNLIDSSTYGSKMPRANSEFIGNQLIQIPSLSEQKEVTNYIEIESNKIENSISLNQTQIKKLKEYKATLINSAVTGKIKVC